MSGNFMEPMYILYTDQAEYYFVCGECFYTFRGAQWSGSTRGLAGWRDASREALTAYQNAGGQCEFCGDKGNGGWMIDGKSPAMERRDARKAQGNTP